MSRGVVVAALAAWVAVLSGGPARAGTGGPDGGGYSWIDNDEPGGPEAAFEDISTQGTEVIGPGSDNRVVTVELGMTFPFYGIGRTTVVISTNGNLHFDAASTAWSNRALPDPARPNAIIAPFWDDLATGSGNVRCLLVEGPPRRFIVQWSGVEHADEPGVPMTFQARLFESGLIAFEYLDLPARGRFTTGSSASIGIEDDSGTSGLTAWRDGSGLGLRSGTSIHFHLGAAPFVPVNPSLTIVRPVGYGVVLAGTAMQFSADVSDPDVDQGVAHEVEILPDGTAFAPQRVTGRVHRSDWVVGGGTSASFLTCEEAAMVSGAYRWRVRAVDVFERTSAWVEPQLNRFEIDLDPPSAPRAMSPAGGIDLQVAWPDGGPVMFRAEAPADAGPAPLSHWDIQVSGDSRFESLEASASDLPGPEAALALRPGRHVRYWRARVWDGAGHAGAWSEPASFRVVADDEIQHAGDDPRRVCGFGAGVRGGALFLTAALVLLFAVFDTQKAGSSS